MSYDMRDDEVDVEPVMTDSEVEDAEDGLGDNQGTRTTSLFQFHPGCFYNRQSDRLIYAHNVIVTCQRVGSL